jgi:hypothetical protein
MSGYTPVFDTVFQGTLCGKYPDLPVWLVLLALQQRGGIIDAHPSYIATISGLPQADIELAIKRFCEPDPASRTPDNDGRRLEPLEGAGFGWRVINHRKYQEKARLSARTARETAERQASPAIPRNPPQSAAIRPSDSNKTKEEKKGAAAPVVTGLDPKAWETWVAYRKVIGKPLNPKTYPTAQMKMAACGSRQMEAVEHSIANNYQGLFPPNSPLRTQPLTPSGLPKVFGETV